MQAVLESYGYAQTVGVFPDIENVLEFHFPDKIIDDANYL
jgi:hypothetical protein